MRAKRRLVRDFLSSKEGNLENITVDYNLYEKLSSNPEHGFIIFKQDVLKEGLQGGQINLPVRRCDLTGRQLLAVDDARVLGEERVTSVLLTSRGRHLCASRE